MVEVEERGIHLPFALLTLVLIIPKTAVRSPVSC